MTDRRVLPLVAVALLSSTNACDCVGKGMGLLEPQFPADGSRAAGTKEGDAGVDVTTRKRVELDFKKLLEERSLADFLGVYLKYHQLLNARLLPYDDLMCRGGTRALVEGTRDFAKTLVGDPRTALARVKDELEAPPLQLAALLCQPEIIALLLRHGADLEAADAHGFTALHWSSCGVATKALVEAGSDAKAKSARGLTPLHLAIDVTSVKALLDAGAELEAQDACGNRALHTANWFGLSFAAIERTDAGFAPTEAPLWLRALGFAADKVLEALRILHERFDVAGALRRAGADATARNAGGILPEGARRSGGGDWDD